MAVDPLAHKYPSLSPYNYTLNNPLKYIDPDGRDGGVLSIPAITAIGVGVIVTAATLDHCIKMATDPSYNRAFNSVVKEATNSVIDGVLNLFSSEDAATETSGSDTESKENSNPFDGPVDGDVNVVDSDGNVIPVEAGEQASGTTDGEWIQVKDGEGNPTGTRKDGGGHPKQKDPKAQKPHGHRVDKNGDPITDETGNPHLPIKY